MFKYFTARRSVRIFFLCPKINVANISYSVALSIFNRTYILGYMVGLPGYCRVVFNIFSE